MSKNDIKKVSVNEKCVIALGCFDGVHKGHLSVINTAKSIALSSSMPLVALTFEIPPKSYFSSFSVPMITTAEQKLELLGELGVDKTVCLPATREFFSMSAEEFINEILLRQLSAAHLVCGYNYSFGKNGSGTVELLKKICAERGVRVTEVEEYTLRGVAISSSLIRDCVAEGRVEDAAEYLGRPYSISGEVVRGQSLARVLGFPTANLLPNGKTLVPRRGVYVTRLTFNGVTRYGITNVGMRPTVNTNIMCAETHIFDFCDDIYGSNIKLEFLYFLREETRFSDVDALAEQVMKDINEAKKYLKEKGLA